MGNDQPKNPRPQNRGWRRKNWYALHRWLGALIGVQLLLWCAGGVFFSWQHMEDVRGTAERNDFVPPVEAKAVVLTVAQAIDTAGATGTATDVRLQQWLGKPVYRIKGPNKTVLVDATNGAILSPINERQARAVATGARRTKPAVWSSVLITADPDIEYRKKPLPAWQVVLDDGKNTHIYVDANTGGITARRNDTWRLFDWFWMLHTMDYWGRDNFHNPLLQFAALLAIAGLASGYLLWSLRLRRKKRP